MSASSPSRTRPSSRCASRTSSASRHAPSIKQRQRAAAARPADQRAAHASGPHHHRRDAWRRGIRHDAGDEHGPRRLAVHHPREFAPRRASPHREHGADGGLRPAGAARSASRSRPPSTSSSRSSGCATARAALSPSARSLASRLRRSRCRTCSSSCRKAKRTDASSVACRPHGCVRCSPTASRREASRFLHCAPPSWQAPSRRCMCLAGRTRVGGCASSRLFVSGLPPKDGSRTMDGSDRA